MPKNSLIKQYISLLELDNIKLVFKKDAIEKIASLAIKRKTGARGLRSILEEIMTDIMYEAPSDKEKNEYIINKEMIEAFYLNDKKYKQQKVKAS